eukprot:6189174-Pleurochrysis_carterae.AAC.4
MECRRRGNQQAAWAEVTRVKLQLRKALHLHELLFCRATPYLASFGLAVQRLQKVPYDRYSTSVEESLVGLSSDNYFSSVVFFKLPLQVSAFDVKLSDPKVRHAPYCA